MTGCTKYDCRQGRRPLAEDRVKTFNLKVEWKNWKSGWSNITLGLRLIVSPPCTYNDQT